jgi:hypothetical protein
MCASSTLTDWPHSLASKHLTSLVTQSMGSTLATSAPVQALAKSLLDGECYHNYNYEHAKTEIDVFVHSDVYEYESCYIDENKWGNAGTHVDGDARTRVVCFMLVLVTHELQHKIYWQLCPDQQGGQASLTTSCNLQCKKPNCCVASNLSCMAASVTTSLPCRTDTSQATSNLHCGSVDTADCSTLFKKVSRNGWNWNCLVIQEDQHDAYVVRAGKQHIHACLGWHHLSVVLLVV